ncbi:hypothetical protein [Thiomicrorhabdus indica]|uniref:hypothetical protein n=1 Tax=Thiomicrorhabdus indica TaxID=2267253 RepID=UPI00102D8EE1|nr:hypothetical protein [Thiomicrorhabdus indica]
MCIFIAALMLIVLYAFMGQVDSLQLVEVAGNDSLVIAQGWEMVSPLWALLAFVFLAGALTVLLVMKLIPAGQESNSQE